MRRLGAALVALLLMSCGARAAQLGGGCSPNHTPTVGDYSCDATTYPLRPNRYQSAQITNATGTAAVVLWQPVTAIASTTMSASSGSNTLTVASASGIAVGQTVMGAALPTGIQAGTVVTAVSGTTITISQLTTATISGGTGVVFFDAQGWNGTKLVSLTCSDTDPTNANTLTLQSVKGGVTMIKEVVSIPAGSGTVAGTPPVDLFNPIFGASPGIPNNMAMPRDNSGNYYFQLTPSDQLQIKVGTTMAAGQTITCDAQASDF